VRIYDRALSANEIEQLYLGGNVASGLVGHWPLDGDADDASGNGNDGTINGTVTFVDDVADQLASPRLGKTHPAIAQIRNLIDAHPVATTLNGAILSGDAQIFVDDNSAFAVGHQLRVEDEWMLVTGVVGGTAINVDRGIAGTTAADHTDGTNIDIIGHPGFIIAPGVPGAAAVGDGVVADQADDPIAHGKLFGGAAIQAATPIGGFAGKMVESDGADDRIDLSAIGVAGSEFENHGGAFAFSFKRNDSDAGAVWAGEDASGNWLFLEYLANGTARLGLSDSGGTNTKLWTTDSAINPAATVFVVDRSAGAFAISEGKRIDATTSTTGTPPTLGDFSQTMALNETSGLANNGLNATTAEISAIFGPASQLSEAEARLIWASMQARRSGGRVPGLSRLPHLARI
jgi:hypothetical protein